LSVAAGICHNVGTAFFHGDHNALQGESGCCAERSKIIAMKIDDAAVSR
jgi:hypothetical protein